VSSRLTLIVNYRQLLTRVGSGFLQLSSVAPNLACWRYRLAQLSYPSPWFSSITIEWHRSRKCQVDGTPRIWLFTHFYNQGSRNIHRFPPPSSLPSAACESPRRFWGYPTISQVSSPFLSSPPLSLFLTISCIF